MSQATKRRKLNHQKQEKKEEEENKFTKIARENGIHNNNIHFPLDIWKSILSIFCNNKKRADTLSRVCKLFYQIVRESPTQYQQAVFVFRETRLPIVRHGSPKMRPNKIPCIFFDVILKNQPEWQSNDLEYYKKLLCTNEQFIDKNSVLSIHVRVEPKLFEKNNNTVDRHESIFNTIMNVIEPINQWMETLPKLVECIIHPFSFNHGYNPFFAPEYVKRVKTLGKHHLVGRDQTCLFRVPAKPVLWTNFTFHSIHMAYMPEEELTFFKKCFKDDVFERLEINLGNYRFRETKVSYTDFSGIKAKRMVVRTFPAIPHLDNDGPKINCENLPINTHTTDLEIFYNESSIGEKSQCEYVGVSARTCYCMMICNFSNLSKLTLRKLSIAPQWITTILISNKNTLECIEFSFCVFDSPDFLSLIPPSTKKLLFIENNIHAHNFLKDIDPSITPIQGDIDQTDVWKINFTSGAILSKIGNLETLVYRDDLSYYPPFGLILSNPCSVGPNLKFLNIKEDTFRMHSDLLKCPLETLQIETPCLFDIIDDRARIIGNTFDRIDKNYPKDLFQWTKTLTRLAIIINSEENGSSNRGPAEFDTYIRVPEIFSTLICLEELIMHGCILYDKLQQIEKLDQSNTWWFSELPRLRILDITVKRFPGRVPYIASKVLRSIRIGSVEMEEDEAQKDGYESRFNAQGSNDCKVEIFDERRNTFFDTDSQFTTPKSSFSSFGINRAYPKYQLKENDKYTTTVPSTDLENFEKDLFVKYDDLCLVENTKSSSDDDDFIIKDDDDDEIYEEKEEEEEKEEQNEEEEEDEKNDDDDDETPNTSFFKEADDILEKVDPDIWDEQVVPPLVVKKRWLQGKRGFTEYHQIDSEEEDQDSEDVEKEEEEEEEEEESD